MGALLGAVAPVRIRRLEFLAAALASDPPDEPGATEARDIQLRQSVFAEEPLDASVGSERKRWQGRNAVHALNTTAGRSAPLQQGGCLCVARTACQRSTRCSGGVSRTRDEGPLLSDSGGSRRPSRRGGSARRSPSKTAQVFVGGPNPGASTEDIHEVAPMPTSRTRRSVASSDFPRLRSVPTRRARKASGTCSQRSKGCSLTKEYR
jgi:hypothetical protein